MGLKVGVDLDNTIVIYDELILEVCKELGVATPEDLVTKEKISNYLKQTGQNSKWTDIQALIYGPEMHRAKVAPGFLDFILTAKEEKSKLTLISNRSPFAAHDYKKKCNLHSCAKKWIKANIPNVFDEIFFKSLAEEKIKLASKMCFDYFIDDLDEMLNKIKVASKCLKINNCIETSSISDSTLKDGYTWNEIAEKIFHKKI